MSAQGRVLSIAERVDGWMLGSVARGSSRLASAGTRDGFIDPLANVREESGKY